MVLIGFLALFMFSAQAQDEKQSSACYAIISPVQGVLPSSFVKINKCTGQTWMLVRYVLTKGGATDRGSYTWQWAVIQHNDVPLSITGP
jgi:hypothetical protein